MEENKRLAVTVLLMLWLLVVSPVLSCPPDGSECKNCIAEQMKYGCPKCVPILRCMARCLWGGSSRSKCSKKCECNGGNPTLAQCKKCMFRCKCSCVA
ncbi:hypothetical protein K2173_017949 [Erythroxylum novogranatense]|uniref:Uncharacterized protein n=1 Tax=Erythroxylum novogranatense TaxID=1862640 RepID=A0AAV8TUJ7_9ROSI|nr:hypothetical protein K2173_017949 [Erythroxylum novogranatense]